MVRFFSHLQRWLFQYLCDQNMVNDRPPNGFKLNVGSPMGVPVNGKTIPSSLRRNGLPKIIGKYPFCKAVKARCTFVLGESHMVTGLGSTYW